MATIKEMRNFLISKNVRVDHMLEKQEIENAYKNSFVEKIGVVHSYVKKIASFDCIVKTNSAKPSIVYVVFHGFGASKEDLESITNDYFKVYNDIKTLFVFPDAFPLSELENKSGNKLNMSDAALNLYANLNSFGWWYINVEDLSKRIINMDIQKIINDEPDGLEIARNKTLFLINTISELYKVDKCKFVLFGFSQGAMLALDLIFHLDVSPLYVGLFSCGPMMQSKYKNILEKTEKCKKDKLLNTPIFQTHGTSDIVIPTIGGELVKQFLSSEKFNNEFKTFNGAHTVSNAMVDYFFQKVAVKARSI